jgi:putative pyruvate formate lyase activating enzyme
MSQYRPEYKASNHPALNRKITAVEYKKASLAAEQLGLANGWFQEFDSSEILFPDFRQDRPFVKK